MKAKKLIAGALSFCIIGSNFIGMNVSAADLFGAGKCGENASWTLDVEGNLIVTGTGEMTDYSYSSFGSDYDGNITYMDWNGEAPPWYGIRDQIKTVTIGSGITYVGDMVFIDCDNLTEINLPDTLEVLGGHCFAYCNALEKVSLPDSVKRLDGDTFECCVSLKDVKLSESLTFIGYAAFARTAVERVVLPESVEELYCLVFDHCPYLSKLVFLNEDCVIFDSENTIYSRVNICGFEGSTAQAYAESYGRNFLPVTNAFELGDVNIDGSVNALDASLVLTEYAYISTTGNHAFNLLENLIADVDSDKMINSLDASYILSYYAYKATGGFLSFEQYMK